MTWMQIRNEPVAEPFSVNRPGAAEKTWPNTGDDLNLAGEQAGSRRPLMVVTPS